MQTQTDVLHCYNTVATRYAATYYHQFQHKHLEKIVLKAFVKENFQKGTMIDFGCGPGDTTAFVNELGLNEIWGTDLSPAMIDEAKKINPQITYQTADMLRLPFQDEQFGSAIAFYAIVHFDAEQLKQAMAEIWRVLKSKGHFLLTFHIGNEQFHHEAFLDLPAPIDFYFWEVETVLNISKAAGFFIIDAIERQPYAGIEYPSKRALIWLEKP
jgi:ubiquinone/menaquinone biosynthesis C-methylase UbiE